jgi:hypothetical protein
MFPLCDQPGWIRDIISEVQPYTMTSPERIAALCQSIAYIERWSIPGDIVECGVWRGGSMMAAALALGRLGSIRTMHLYDTFAGMPKPTAHDIEAASGKSAADLLASNDVHVVASSGIDEVKSHLARTGYPETKLKFVLGKVEDTIPKEAPDQIALLRLDTDWYESTRHELEHLWPRLSPLGILIVDDYGHWTGAQKAVDEFIDRSPTPLFLHRIDYTGRLLTKPYQTR